MRVKDKNKSDRDERSLHVNVSNCPDNGDINRFVLGDRKRFRSQKPNIN